MLVYLCLYSPLHAAIDSPIASIAVGTSSGEIPFTLHANAGSSYSPAGHALIEFEWTTSDNRNAQGSQVNFTFDRIGTYTLVLRVTDTQGLKGTAIQTITVIPIASLELNTNTNPIARFELSTDHGTIPFSLHLEGSTSQDEDGQIISYEWISSDGQTAQGSSADFQFNQAGTYNVSLRVTDDKGGIATHSQLVQVASDGGLATDNQKPTARFSIIPDRGVAPLTLSLDGRRSFDPDGVVRDYRWFTSDGQATGGPLVLLTLNTPGTYSISLRVTDDKGLVDTVSHQVTVLSPISASSNSNVLPIAEFTATPLRSGSPLVVKLDAAASGDADGQIVDYQWLTSDGQTRSGIRTEFQFDRFGAYLITLRIIDNSGGVNNSSQQVEVLREQASSNPQNLAPIAAFNFSQDSSNPTQVSLDAAASRDQDGSSLTLQYAWLTSYGEQFTGRAPKISLPGIGDFRVQLTVTDPEGAQDSFAETISVVRNSAGVLTGGQTTEPSPDPEKLGPIADFIMTPENSAIPVTVALDASASTAPSGTIVQYLWTLSNNLSLIGPSTAFSLDTVGRYGVTLTVTDSNGLSHSISKTFGATAPIDTTTGLDPAPVADFDVSIGDPVIPPPVIIVPIRFTPLNVSYSAGESVVLEVLEDANSQRQENVDLWAAMQTSDGQLLFLNNNPRRPLSPTGQALKLNIATSQRIHRLFTFEIPPVLQGSYDFYAVYVQAGRNPVTDGFTVLRSTLLVTTLNIQ